MSRSESWGSSHPSPSYCWREHVMAWHELLPETHPAIDTEEIIRELSM